ncbi:MAG: NUDIX hydrolase [Actinomycetota bacterium]
MTAGASGLRALPPALAERAREFVERGLEPVPPRPASTVVLLRDSAQGPEVYLLRRRSSMAFAAGMHAFPGGAVDERDVADPVVSWHGPAPGEWARLLGVSEPEARGFVLAAVRETFEEAGVLLADHANPVRHAAKTDLAPTGPDWEAERTALVERRLALSELLDRRGLAVRSDLLAPWAHWVTPRFEKRRYDTWFFVAALPESQAARDVSGEADQVVWVRPEEALATAARGEVALLPPTWSVLTELAAFASVSAVLDAAAHRALDMAMPGWVDDGDAVRLLLPGDPGFPGDDEGRR